MYLTPGDHALVTKFQRRLAKLSLKTFAKVQKDMLHTSFNRRGRAIKNWARFMLATIALTVSKTQTWVKTFCDNPTRQLLIPLKGLVDNVQRILKGLMTPLSSSTSGPSHQA
jgi:hypothetical protein